MCFTKWLRHSCCSTDLGVCCYESTLSMIFLHTTISCHYQSHTCYKCSLWVGLLIMKFSLRSSLFNLFLFPTAGDFLRVQHSCWSFHVFSPVQECEAWNPLCIDHERVEECGVNPWVYLSKFNPWQLDSYLIYVKLEIDLWGSISTHAHKTYTQHTHSTHAYIHTTHTHMYTYNT